MRYHVRLASLIEFFLNEFNIFNDTVAQILYCKTCLKRSPKKRPKLVLNLILHNAG